MRIKSNSLLGRRVFIGLLLLFAPVSLLGYNGTTAVVINEIQISTSGTDWEFVELQALPGTDLSDLVLLEIESDFGSGAGTIDLVINLNGQSIPSSGFWVAISPAGSAAYGVTGDLSIGDNSFENSTATYLLVAGFTGSEGDDLDSDDNGTLDSMPWDHIVDSINIRDSGASDFDYGAPSVGPDGAFLPAGTFRCPDGSTGAFGGNFHNFTTPDGTPGTANNCSGGEVCGATFTPIYAIQGSGLMSPLEGSVLSTEGQVVADFQTGKGGFFLQDPNGDEDASTSDGIFIFSTLVDVSVGDRIRVRGEVDEFFNLTEITSVDQIVLCSSGHTLAPTELTLPVPSLNALEAFEGMLVTFPQPLTILDHSNFDRFGEILLGTERQYQPTALFEPGSFEVTMLAEQNQLSRILLDDARDSQNPDPAIHPNGSDFDLDNLFRAGDILENVTGVLDFGFGEYKIQPTQPAVYVPDNPRSLAPDDVGGNLKVASFNVLNYFTTLDDSGPICGPTGGQDCRGADDALEFLRQRDKLVSALAGLNADIVGLIEIENHPTDEPVEDLVIGLNDLLGATTYDLIPTGPIGQDAIRVAFIYKTAAVTPMGNFAILDSSVDPLFLDLNRPALAQSFEHNANGMILTAVVNHLKSKGSPCDDVGDPDTGDGAGNCNLTRTAAAMALVDWLATDPTGSGSEDFLILGDLNSYAQEDPIDTMKAGGFSNLLETQIGELAYSFIFDGQLGYFNYILASSDLVDSVTGVTEWHINADEADLIDYDTTFKQDAQDAIYEPNAFRSSDHDPVIVGLDLCDNNAPALSISLSPDRLWPVNHKLVRVEASVVATDDVDPVPLVELVSVTSNEDDNGRGDGATINDIVVVDDFTFELRAERSAHGDGRIYTITYRATDLCGNQTEASATVSVPHDRR